MPINKDNPEQWLDDIDASVAYYNEWFMIFAPEAFRDTRAATSHQVDKALAVTKNLTDLTPQVLMESPDILPILRMATCPPIARDRLMGIAGLSKNLISKMEDPVNPSIPPRMPKEDLMEQLDRLLSIIQKMADPDLFLWLSENRQPTESEKQRAAAVIADRLCGNITDPIIRNAQEKRQLTALRQYLKHKGYSQVDSAKGVRFNELKPGEFSFRMNIPVYLNRGSERQYGIHIPINAVVQPLSSRRGDFPLLLEAKSAGDFTNVNKRRKEEAQKMQQLRNTYGPNVRFVLFLCGYFDAGYLGYEASEGIDWIWEHRIDDLEEYL